MHILSFRAVIVFFILEFLLLGVLALIGSVPWWEFLVASAVLFAALWLFDRPQLREWRNRMTTAHLVLLTGLAFLWLSMTAIMGTVAWMVATGTAVLGAVTTSKEEGPLIWFANLVLEGGPPTGRNVFSLRFKGHNSSTREVRLKSAELRSANKGTTLPLEVVAMNDAGKNEIVPIEEIELVPAGAPIELVARFNLPDGLNTSDFLATWSKFNLVVIDDTREYRVPFNEGHLAVFFPGLIGPHITKKPDTTK
jgi:hypothetical protein